MGGPGVLEFCCLGGSFVAWSPGVLLPGYKSIPEGGSGVLELCCLDLKPSQDLEFELKLRATQATQVTQGNPNSI